MDNINNILSDDRYFIVIELQSLEKEAKEAAELIQKTYKCFGINQERIEVFRNEDGYEELSYFGVWYAHYPNENYSLKCTPEYIYKVYKAESLVRNGIAKEYDDGKLTDEGHRVRVYAYFKKFLQRTRERFDNMQ